MIKIHKAKENNLKNISVDIPINKITSIIGVSGSGKSSLIYGVLASEAKRREKIDSGNADCLDYAIRAKFEKIDNLPYCVTLKQRALSQSISSTLSTISSLHELLRYELVSYGNIIGENGNIIDKPNSSDIKSFINKFHKKEKCDFFAIVCFAKYTNGKQELDILNKNGIKEAIFISSFDNKKKIKKVKSIKELSENYNHTILVPFDNIDDIEKYDKLAICSFLCTSKDKSLNFDIDYFDMTTGKIYQKKSPQLLSFNSSSDFSGKCDKCTGHGKVSSIDTESLILKNKNLNENFLNIESNNKNCYKHVGLCDDTIDIFFKKNNIKANQTYYQLSKAHQELLKELIYPQILKHQNKPSIGKFITNIECNICNGTRLNYKANAIKLYGLSISDFLSKTVNQLYSFLQDKKLHHQKILNILKALEKATLGYLPLNRTTDTLSGGELQRLKFALELNNDYKDLLYILDEPSSGLHPYNNNQMINLIKNLRDKGNTIIISEHNNDYINQSDFIVELGHGSGEQGGKIIFQGAKISDKNNNFIRKKIDFDRDNCIELIDVNINNIKNENFLFPLNCLIAISGVSGSGKSSLVHKALIPSLNQYLADKSYKHHIVKEIKGVDKIKSVIELTQSSIGINSRSIVATYLNIFDLIRDIYASLQASRDFDFTKSNFSFNSYGACEVCKGLGEIESIVCHNCLAKRYKPEVLEIEYCNLNIYEFLNSPIDKLESIAKKDKLKFAFKMLKKLGLSHLTLGRTTPTLSGGEAQRLKLAKVLIESFNKIKLGSFLFVLDEPTNGLSDKDINKLYDIFDEILSHNNSIIIIEHNLEIIKNSDFIIDIGLSSGENGGKNIFSGSFNDLLKNNISLTAKAYNKKFENIEDIKINTSDLKEKKFKNIKKVNCNGFYLDDKHFKIEKEFSENYNVYTDNKNHKYFKSKNELFDFANSLENIEISFNPYTSYLSKYKNIPLSIKKKTIKHLKELGFNINNKDFLINEWEYRIKSKDINQAYNFGKGWVSVQSKNIKYEIFTKLVSIKNKIIGSAQVNEKTFSLYLNSCIYCDGSSRINAYALDLLVANKNKSILDKGFLHSNIKFNLKSTISRFQKEKLFDFAKPFNSLSKKEKYIFLFGFKEYKFLKPKGRIEALGDYIRWQGLYKYVFDDLKKIETSNNIKDSKHSELCPFCKHGFKQEVEFYFYKGKNMIDIISEVKE